MSHTTSTISSLLGEYSAHVIQVCGQLEPLGYNSHPPGTHHCWVGRGNMERDVCPTCLYMTSSGNRIPDLLIHYATCFYNTLNFNPTEIQSCILLTLCGCLFGYEWYHCYVHNENALTLHQQGLSVIRNVLKEDKDCKLLITFLMTPF